MKLRALLDRLECFPIIAAVRDDRFPAALSSPVDILFYLEARLSCVRQRIRQAHEAEKLIFVHIDLAGLFQKCQLRGAEAEPFGQHFGKC